MRMSYNKALKYARSGRVLYRVMIQVRVDRFVKPHTESIEVYAEPQWFTGKRKYSHVLNGTYGGYFTKRHQAERFAQEVRDGLHEHLVSAAAEFCYEMDMMDELMGICDRGLGGFVPNHELFDYDDEYYGFCR